MKPPLRPHHTGLPPWLMDQPSPLCRSNVFGFRITSWNSKPPKSTAILKNVEIEEYIKLIQIEFPKLKQLTKTIRTSIIYTISGVYFFLIFGDELLSGFLPPLYSRLHLTPPYINTKKCRWIFRPSVSKLTSEARPRPLPSRVTSRAGAEGNGGNRKPRFGETTSRHHHIGGNLEKRGFGSHRGDIWVLNQKLGYIPPKIDDL